MLFVSGRAPWARAGIIHWLLLASLWQQYTNKPQIRLFLCMILNSPKGNKLINAILFRCNTSLRNLRRNGLEHERDCWLCYPPAQSQGSVCPSLPLVPAEAEHCSEPPGLLLAEGCSCSPGHPRMHTGVCELGLPLCVGWQCL